MGIGKHTSNHLTFEITPAEVSDASAIATIGFTVWAATFAWSVSREDCDAYLNSVYTTEACEQMIADPTSSIYVARSKDSVSKVLGFAQLKRGTTEPCLKDIKGSLVELQRIYVDGETHGRGVGRGLINFVQEKARQEGFEHMWLGVWEQNPKAYGLYERMGFQRVGDHDFVIGGETQTDWVLVKKL